MSAPRPGALPSIFSLEPGTARHVRRGRFRERSDMRETVVRALRTAARTPVRRSLQAWPADRDPAPSSPTACTSGCSPGGETGVANAGVVVDDDGITVIDTLMVRSQWEPFAAAVARARAPGAALRAHPRAHRPRGRHEGVPRGRGLRHAGHELSARPADADRRATRRSCRRSPRSSTTSPSSAPARSPTWSTARRSSRRASSCSPASGHTAGDLHRARRRRRRVLRRRPLLLRRHAARVPGRPRGVGRHARRRSPSSPT